MSSAPTPPWVFILCAWCSVLASVVAGCEDAPSRLEAANVSSPQERYAGPTPLEAGLAGREPGDVSALYLVDDETPYRDSGVPYMQALKDSELAAPGVAFELGPDYGSVRDPWFAWAPTRAALRSFFEDLPSEWTVDEGFRVMFAPELRGKGSRDLQMVWRAYVVRDPPAAGGDWVARSEQGLSSSGEANVQLELNPAAVEAFGQLTADNVGRKVAIAVGDWVVSDPVVNHPISEGTLSVSVGHQRSMEELIKAMQLARLLADVG